MRLRLSLLLALLTGGCVVSKDDQVAVSPAGAGEGSTTGGADAATGADGGGDPERPVDSRGETADAGPEGSTGEATTAGTGDAPGDSGSTSGGGMGSGGSCDAYAFVESRATWQALRDEHDDTYWYTAHLGSISGFGPNRCSAITLVVVESGSVVRRVRYEATGFDGYLEECGEPFVEEGDEVGSHARNTATAPPWTLDDVYAACCAELLAVEWPRDTQVLFNVDRDGLLRGCEAYDATCCDHPPWGPAGWGGDPIAIVEVGFDAPPR